MKALVIGGTRNVGPGIVSGLLERGADVTVFHRGQTRAELSPAVREVLGDRTDPEQLRRVEGDFDAIIDTTLYRGAEAHTTADVFAGRVGRYVMLSTGQVYLVRTGPARPFREEHYDGPTMEAPGPGELPEWLYGMDKRAAEDALRDRGFPAIALRLPMINSERDHHDRIAGYLARLRDGGPVLVPEGPGLALRHVYGGDVARAAVDCAAGAGRAAQAYNISQDEEIGIGEFLEALASLAGATLRVARVPRETLTSNGLLPRCSPFSGTWMSNLDNARSKRELGMTYTPLSEYLPRLVDYLNCNPRIPAGWEQRARELAI